MSEDVEGRPSQDPPAGPRFTFVHKLFSLPGVRFEKDGHSGEPVLKVQLGDVSAAMTFATLRKSFGLPPGSPDSSTLEEISKALKYVNRIKPGDVIPSEILTGAASWKVEPHHLKIARGRITAGLLHFLGEGVAARSSIEFAALAADEGTKFRVQEAFGKIAQRIGLPDDRKAEVVDLVDRLCTELSYIEALRERVHKLRANLEAVKRMKSAYRKERSVFEGIGRISHLLEGPIRRYEARLLEVDAQAGEVSNVIANLDRQIGFIRTARDWLFSEMLVWEKNIGVWPDANGQSNREVQQNISALYRFAASHFPLVQEWGHS